MAAAYEIGKKLAAAHRALRPCRAALVVNTQSDAGADAEQRAPGGQLILLIRFVDPPRRAPERHTPRQIETAD